MPPSNSAATSLKKSEGVALTRYDLQYSTLEKIFYDDKKVWQSKYDPDAPPCSFYDLFVEDFLTSVKLSKSLADRFRADEEGCRETTYIHLLCNIGRINTTLIFTPTQMRLFNPVPCIQVHDRGGKLLQDAPRLKAILKGSCEDVAISPPTVEALYEAMAADSPKPLSTPINLLFLISAEESKLTQHFDVDMDYHQLFSRPDLDSDDRARAFLFIVWHYMNTNGTAEDSTRNPYGTGEATIKVPPLRSCPIENAKAENVELLEEVEYAAVMFEERQKWLRNALAKYDKSNSDAIAAEKMNADSPGGEASDPKIEDADATMHRDDDDAASVSATPRSRRSRTVRNIAATPHDAANDEHSTPAYVQQRQNALSRKVAAQPTGQLRTELSLQEFKAKRIDQIMRHRLKYTRHIARSRRRAVSGLQREAHYILTVLDARGQDADESWRPDHVETSQFRRQSIDFADSVEEIREMLDGEAVSEAAPPRLMLAGEEGLNMARALRRAEARLAELRGEEVPAYAVDPRAGEMRRAQPAPVEAPPPAAIVAPEPVAENLTPAEEDARQKLERDRARRAAAARARRAVLRERREQAARDEADKEAHAQDETKDSIMEDSHLSADQSGIDTPSRAGVKYPHFIMPAWSSPPGSVNESMHDDGPTVDDDGDERQAEYSNEREHRQYDYSSDDGGRGQQTSARRHRHNIDYSSDEAGDANDDNDEDNTIGDVEMRDADSDDGARRTSEAGTLSDRDRGDEDDEQDDDDDDEEEEEDEDDRVAMAALRQHERSQLQAQAEDRRRQQRDSPQQDGRVKRQTLMPILSKTSFGQHTATPRSRLWQTETAGDGSDRDDTQSASASAGGGTGTASPVEEKRADAEVAETKPLAARQSGGLFRIKLKVNRT